MLLWYCVVCLYVASLTTCEIVESDLQDLSSKLHDAQKDLPEGLQNLTHNLPPGIKDIQINESTIQNVQQTIEDKCRKNGGDEAVEKLELAKANVMECVTSFANLSNVEEEIEKAKPTGDLDIVFKKYCGKSPEIVECVTNFTDVAQLCLEEKEKENVKLFHNISNRILDFVCYKEGDRIALFIAEGGKECVSSKQEQITHCVNSTVGKHVPSEVPSIDNLPLLLIGSAECESFEKLKECVVNSLEDCKEPTPANIAGSMFDFVHTMLPCPQKPNGSSSVWVSWLVTISALLFPLITT